MARYDSILQTVGATPVIRIRDLAPEHVRLFAKLEAANPLGSIKDRLALGIIEDAERRGRLKPGQTVVEATSGNTGIGLAMVCAAKGYPLVVVMAENFSVERRKIMRFLGARVVLTPAPLRGTGMLAKAVELAEAHGWFLCRQFENEANAEIHARTTAREILADFEGERLDHWVTGFGTGGTLKGVAGVLRAERPDTEIVVCEPENSRMLESGIPQPRNRDGSPSQSHPRFQTHLVQGWAPDFIPKLTEDAREEGWIDRCVPIDSGEAVRLSHELARREGIFVGISGGATLAGALQVCAEAAAGSTVLCMLPDTAERYLSTPLFEDIAEEMTEEEVEISRSTPNYRFDSPAAACPIVGDVGAAPEASAEALAFVDGAVSSSDDPVVLFAFEWCEFCWSIRKLFSACGIEYRSIDLDKGEFLADEWGERVRSALRVRTGSATVPQIFIGGENVGGCTEVFSAFRDGTLAKLLAGIGRPLTADAELDPDKMLPSWLHRRG